jgi:hypothetical protein
MYLSFSSAPSSVQICPRFFSYQGVSLIASALIFLRCIGRRHLNPVRDRKVSHRSHSAWSSKHRIPSRRIQWVTHGSWWFSFLCFCIFRVCQLSPRGSIFYDRSRLRRSSDQISHSDNLKLLGVSEHSIVRFPMRFLGSLCPSGSGVHWCLVFVSISESRRGSSPHSHAKQSVLLLPLEL